MKFYLAGITAATTLLLTSSCGSVVKSRESSHGGHPTHEHVEDAHYGESVATQAKLTAPKNLAPNQSIPLVINIQDPTGKAVANFEIFQEKLMHLILVRDDLQSFNHIHPDYKGNGRFEVKTNFPTPGGYTIFSDYKPAGQKEQVSVMSLNIPGSVPLPKELEKFHTTKTLTETKVNLKFSKPIKAGKEVTLIFDLKQAGNNQPVQDLQPYLGEKGHLVIVKSSYPLTATDYIHAHSLKETTQGQVHFVTKFPQSGTYKLWIQFNRNGKINTANFWVNVS